MKTFNEYVCEIQRLAHNRIDVDRFFQTGISLSNLNHKRMILLFKRKEKNFLKLGSIDHKFQNWVTLKDSYIFTPTVTFLPRSLQTIAITVWVALFDIMLSIVCWSFWYRITCIAEKMYFYEWIRIKRCSGQTSLRTKDDSFLSYYSTLSYCVYSRWI